GVEAFSGMTGSVIFHVARCEKCRRTEPPSHVGEKCSCGGVLKAQKADFVTMDINDPLRRDIARRIAIMLQRTFALYGDERVITN
ncbi:methyl coenzyme M reductase system, component A2, partial [Citrobacter sp. AAK_AS5]